MKTNLLKLVAIFCLSNVFISAYATDGDPKDERISNMRTQLIDLVDNPDLSYSDREEVEANLHFFINKNSEVVVLSVDTESVFVTDFLKKRLNYKKIKDNVLRGPYSMKITLKKGKV